MEIKYFRKNFRTYAAQFSITNNKCNLWGYVEQGREVPYGEHILYYLGKYENHKIIESDYFRQLPYMIQLYGKKLMNIIEDHYKLVDKGSLIGEYIEMPEAIKTKRNRELYKLRMKDKKKWSFSKLGDKFGITKSNAHKLFYKEMELSTGKLVK